MKADFSRPSFDRKKHYRSVLMQQGRVQMDSDWNEQLSIDQHVDQTTTKDIVGPDGVPIDGGGFRIDTKPDGSDLLISAGRIYVDGILCENEAPISYADQFAADYPDSTAVAAVLKSAPATIGIAYLDVWERHITALEDPHIREVALGGPDTATRAKIVWQVKVLPILGAALPVTPDLPSLLAQRIAVAVKLEAAEKAGDTVAIAKLSAELAAINGALGKLLTPSGLGCLMPSAPWNTLVTPSSGQVTARVHPGQTPANACELLPLGGFQRLENQLYRVEIHDGGTMGTATFKWSRENGSVVTSWLGQDILNLKVASTGRDAPLGFASGEWVELTDDTHDLLGKPGMMVQIDKVEGDVLTMKAPVSGTIKFTDYPRNPKIRRWDQPDAVETVAVPATNGGYIALEGGVEILFSGAQFKTGDYWLIPARTAIADTEIGGIEWPEDAGGNPLALSPAGILHHFTRLALVFLDAGGKLNILSDCRNRFPAVTQLTELFYLGGDGQSAQPGAILAQPLRAGVSIGKLPVTGAKVRFQVILGTGTLTGNAASFDALTDSLGVASCTWTIDAVTPSQVVEAQLVGADGSLQHLPIHYSAVPLEEQQSILRINDLLMADNFPLRNGSQVIPDEMSRGIRIVCNGPVMNASLARSLSCFVTVFLPYPLGNNNIFDFGTGSLGYEPVIVRGQVNVDSTAPNVINWHPQGEASKWMLVFFQRLANFNFTAVPMLLTVKGNFILPVNAPFLPLDADGFIDPNTGLLRLPTGDGRPGGDLELYFWFVPQRAAYYAYGNQVPFTHIPFSGIGSDLI